MKIIDSIITYFKKPESETRDMAPDGLCPVCWGHQQYDNKIRTILKDKQIDVNNHKDSYMIIQEFVKTNIDGITLKDPKIQVCPKCGSESKNSQREHTH